MAKFYCSEEVAESCRLAGLEVKASTDPAHRPFAVELPPEFRGRLADRLKRRILAAALKYAGAEQHPCGCCWRVIRQPLPPELAAKKIIEAIASM